MSDEIAAIYSDLGAILSGFIFEVDAELCFVRVAGTLPHAGVSDPRALHGRSLLDIADVMTDLQARHIFSRKLRQREKITGLRYRAPGSDKEGHCFELNAQPRHGERGFEGYRGLIRDVTEVEKAEKELIAAQELVETASRAKSEFLTSISHELRTPLNAIIGFSEILHGEMLGSLGNERYHEYVADILASGRALLNLVNDILDISRLEARKMKLREDELDVAKAVRSSIEIFAARFREKELTVGVTTAPDLPALWCDSRAVRQMLAHLLSNAYKFTEIGDDVHISADLAEDGSLRISVADTGIGIPKDRLDNVLMPFVQGHGVFTRPHGGSGLGLPIAKALIELHNGHLELGSEEGVGTRVALVFPPERVLHPASAPTRSIV